MFSRRNRTIDVVSAGELLIDLISRDYAESLADARDYVRLQGGSPANFALNLARLGNAVKLCAAVGTDEMGDFLTGNLQAQGLDTAHIERVAAPTTLILVTRSKEVSNFQAYRGADTFLGAEGFRQIPWHEVSVFHTTCFALSMEPARSQLFMAARNARKAGCQISIDANYAPKIGPSLAEAREMVAQYVGLGALVKISEVDWERLYGHPVKDPRQVLHHFLQLGASEVVLTLGGDGAWAGNQQGETFLPAQAISVVDTTGAGDAFWSGYITAWLDGKELDQCLVAGRTMAEIKLQHFGPLENPIDKQLIYSKNDK